MRSLLIVAGLWLALLIPAYAADPTFDTPRALLDYAYKPYATGDFKDDSGLLYSKGLKALFVAAGASASDSDDLGPVDFDVFVNGQDYQLTNLKIGDPSPEGEGVKVPVTLDNFDEPQSLVFHLVREDGGWKIGDIESLTPGAAWRLTTLLTPDNSNAGDGASGAAGAAGLPGTRGPVPTGPDTVPPADGSAAPGTGN